MKKNYLAILLIAMILLVTGMKADAAEQKTITLTAGQKKEITTNELSGKVQWKLKDQSSVSIKTAGKNKVTVYARKSGRTVLEGKTAQQTVTYNIVVKPAKIQQQRTKVYGDWNSEKSVKLRWSKIKGADGYLVYRGLIGGKKQLIKKVKGAKHCSFKDTLKNSEKKYSGSYYVRAYKKTKAGITLYSKYNTECFIKE